MSSPIKLPLLTNKESFCKRRAEHPTRICGVGDEDSGKMWKIAPSNFGTCRALPNNWEINKEELIRLWIAEGFVPQPLQGEGEGDETMEDIDKEYLEELVSKSMVQVSKRSSSGMGVKTCQIHDVMCINCKRREFPSCCSALRGKYDSKIFFLSSLDNNNEAP
ncbi:unnamed protein product [Dovyalis caffra]|uniref:Disease resistance protein winged helix domain-containing protein n=1 Tax=Dovyalis caffra TaxID=77055 RepID=A0AAV1QYA6_9ROSI|nr:unnamed protein product [Dovyalis caffra]